MYSTKRNEVWKISKHTPWAHEIILIFIRFLYDIDGAVYMSNEYYNYMVLLKGVLVEGWKGKRNVSYIEVADLSYYYDYRTI